MKILDEKHLSQAFKDEAVQLEAHEHSPFFKVNIDSVLIDGEQELNIVENFYTVELMGQLYAKMDSTHKNRNGSFSGAEGTYYNAMSTERQKLWAEQFELVTTEQIMLLRGLHEMTPEEYRQHRIKEYMAKQNETEIEFSAEVKGQTLHFFVGSQKKHEMQFQLMMMQTDPTKTLTLHDIEFKNDEDFNAEETQIILGEMMKATLIKEFTEGAFIKRLLLLEKGFTKEDVDTAASPPLTEKEQAWIYAEVARKLG